jgi:N-acetyl-gamma-glutamyl-phosphate reductase
VREVRETNFCRLSVHRDERTGRVIVFAAIDNLWKGAASQAVQNLNLMFGLPEGEGIS